MGVHCTCKLSSAPVDLALVLPFQHYSDERLKKTNELLHGVKLLKMYAWEELYTRAIKASREMELKFLLRGSLSMMGISKDRPEINFMELLKRRILPKPCFHWTKFCQTTVPERKNDKIKSKGNVG